MMVPIVVTLAHQLQVDSRPFIMGVTACTLIPLIWPFT